MRQTFCQSGSRPTMLPMQPRRSPSLFRVTKEPRDWASVPPASADGRGGGTSSRPSRAVVMLSRASRETSVTGAQEVRDPEGLAAA